MFHLNWLFPEPARCAFCSRPAARPVADREVANRVRLCLVCREELSWIEDPRCEQCGRPFASTAAGHVGQSRGWHCGDCERMRHREGDGVLVKNRAVVQYTSLARHVLSLFKYRGRETLAEPCGKLMADLVRREYRQEMICAVTYVPLHAKREAARGFNQAELLANVIGRELRRPVYSLLSRTKDTPKQSKQSRRERIMGMENVFKARDPGQRNFCWQGTLLIVDDVYTTGTTLGACARELQAAGASRVVAVTFAR